MRLLLVTCVLVATTAATLIGESHYTLATISAAESERCGTFYCPDTCRITYYNGCAHRCNCGGLVRCPPVRCPAPAPICEVHTLLDGCQTCACRLPFAVVDKAPDTDNSTDTFVFLSTTRFEEQMSERETVGGERIVAAHTCTLTMLEKIDACLAPAMGVSPPSVIVRRERAQFEHEMAANRTSSSRVDRTLNPMMRPSLGQMSGMCTHMGHALRCMGKMAYEQCRHSHMELAQLDAVYGYPCGPKQAVFAHHMECIQRAYERDFRMYACEDAARRSMGYISQGDVDDQEGNEYKLKQKCNAMTWLMGCEKPSIGRYCSAEAARVHEESMGAVTAYMAPECELDYTTKVFTAKKSSRGGAVKRRIDEVEEFELSPKEELICSPAEQAEVDEHFGALFKEVQRTQERASLAYPLAYWYREDKLDRTCRQYQTALTAIKSSTKRDCINKYEVYSQVFYTLHYPCGYATSSFYQSHQTCVKQARRDKVLRECEFLAHQRLEDASNGVCETYDILTDCMYDHIVAKCGYDAMEMEFQYLSFEVRRQVPECRLRRLFRFVDEE